MRQNKKSIIIIILIAIIILVPSFQSHPLTRKHHISNQFGYDTTISYRWNPRNVEITLKETIENHGNATINASIHLPIPMNLSSQIIDFPIRKNINPGENITIEWKINATVYTIRHLIFPWKIKGEIPSDIYDKYTSDESKYQINNPIIQDIVNEQTEDIKNPLIKAIILCNYVGDHLSYVLDDRWDDAPTVLTRGNGSCSEYCFVYIALLRAAGIPARYMGGTVLKSNEVPYVDSIFHRIVEIYLPNYGWIPVDPTWGDYVRIPFYYFGSYQNKFFVMNVGGGPSEFLDWNYCHWEEWTPESENVTYDISFTWEKFV